MTRTQNDGTTAIGNNVPFSRAEPQSLPRMTRTPGSRSCGTRRT